MPPNLLQTCFLEGDHQEPREDRQRSWIEPAIVHVWFHQLEGAAFKILIANWDWSNYCLNFPPTVSVNNEAPVFVVISFLCLPLPFSTWVSCFVYFCHGLFYWTWVKQYSLKIPSLRHRKLVLTSGRGISYPVTLDKSCTLSSLCPCCKVRGYLQNLVLKLYRIKRSKIPFLWCFKINETRWNYNNAFSIQRSNCFVLKKKIKTSISYLESNLNGCQISYWLY